MIPLVHDLSGETVLIFGGGRVGARRARTFARECRVLVISPRFVDDPFGGATRIRAAPTPATVGDWIDRVDPVLVIAATDDKAVNAAVERAAGRRRLQVNRADSADGGTVSIPATIRDGPVIVAIGTGGTSPTLAAHLRSTLASDIAGAGEMATLLADLRAELADWPADRRRSALARVVASERVWKALGAGDPNAAQLAAEIAESTGESE